MNLFEVLGKIIETKTGAVDLTGQLPVGSTVTSRTLEDFGLYNIPHVDGRPRKIGTHLIYWGPGKGNCLLDETETPGVFRVYQYTKRPG